MMDGRTDEFQTKRTMLQQLFSRTTKAKHPTSLKISHGMYSIPYPIAKPFLNLHMYIDFYYNTFLWRRSQILPLSLNSVSAAEHQESQNLVLQKPQEIVKYWEKDSMIYQTIVTCKVIAGISPVTANRFISRWEKKELPLPFSPSRLRRSAGKGRSKEKGWGLRKKGKENSSVE